MPRNTQRLSTCISLALLCAFVLVGVRALAQDQIEAKDDPIFNEYKGVRLGMTADECRQKLGTPQDKGDTQDFYAFSEKETAQVNYNAQHQVMSIAVIYIGADKAPASKAIIGADLTAKADGSMYRLVRYPKAGYWVSYSRTAGDSPLITVMMQRYKP
jgi:outer membrane protein assembly factor BamE (lipoprotein component of BamABCDE complex)